MAWPHCDECRRIADFYMVKDEVWLSVAPTRESILCFACLESRLGRPLTLDDFPRLPINRGIRKGYEIAWRERAESAVPE